MRTAVIGTGIMGAAMAGSLAREGHDVAVWNRTRERAQAAADTAGDRVRVADSVTDAVHDAEVVVTMLFDTDAVLAVADELAAGLAEGAVWVQTSTVGPDGARRIGATAPGRVLDAPVLGTRKPAEDGTLVVLASGPPALLETARPALEAIGSRTVVVGEDVGQGSALKLSTNAWVGLVTAAAAQSLSLARVQGLDPQLFLDAIAGGAADSPYAHLKGAAMIALQRGEEPPLAFALDGVRKDLGLMIEAARGGGMRDDLLRTTLGLYDAASERGHGGADLAAVVTAFDTDTDTDTDTDPDPAPDSD